MTRIKFLIAILVLLFSFTLVSCGGSDVVTEEEWKSAFTLSNFDNVVIDVIEYPSTPDEEYKNILKVDSGIYYVNEQFIENDVVVYSCEYYYFNDFYGTWELKFDEETNSWLQYEDDDEFYVSVREYFHEICRFKYSEFSYDESKQCYVGIVDGMNYAIYFANGKVSKINKSYLDKPDSGTSYVFHSYGKVDLELPEFIGCL
ncbi:MAG: hypothetical protein IKT40_01735 [Bacilli bacterium]|nr:hypothetical protein [Bacilli bacterium]